MEHFITHFDNRRITYCGKQSALTHRRNEGLFIMKRILYTIYIPLLILAIAINFSAVGQAAEIKLSPEQRKIWGLVELYWETAQAGDLEGLMNLIHDKYVFWPKGYTVTFNKSEREFLFTKWLAHFPLNSYELSLRSIQFFENFAIVYYSYNSEGSWGSDTQRRTNVWMKDNGKWKLIGGMGAELNPCLK